MLVQVENLEVVRVDFVLQPLDVLFELVEPSAVQFLIDLLEQKRSQPPFKLKLGLLKLYFVPLEGLPEAALHPLNLASDHMLVLIGSFSKSLGKLSIVIHDSLLQFLYLDICLCR